MTILIISGIWLSSLVYVTVLVVKAPIVNFEGDN
jgi:hypothetical protein